MEDPFADLFDNPALSDVLLVLSTGSEASTSQRPVKRAKKGGRKTDNEQARLDDDQLPPGRKLAAHGTVLLRVGPRS